MSKLLHIDTQHGSPQNFIDGNIYSFTGSKIKFKDNDKGIVISNDGTASNYINITGSETWTNTGDWSFSIPFYSLTNPLNGIMGQRVTAINTGWSISLIGTTLSFIIYDGSGSITISTTIQLRKWYLITIIKSNNTVTCYLNNATFGTYTSVFLYSNSIVTIGRIFNNNTNYCFNGSIGTPKLWNHALSTAERNAEWEWFYGLKRHEETKINPIDYYQRKATSDNRSGILLHCSYRSGSVDDLTTNLKHGTKTGNVQRIKEGISLRTNGNVAHGAIGNVKTVAFRIRLKSTTEALFERAGNTGMVSVSAGTLTAGEFSSIYIEGQVGTTMAANFWYDVVLRNAVALDFSAFTLGLNNLTYGNFDIEDLILSSTQESDAWVKAYHNQFASRCMVQSALGFDSVNNSAKEWVKGTTSSIIINQLAASAAISPSGTIPKGTKYIKFGSAGTAYLPTSFLSFFVKNGYADYYALVSGTWYHRQGFVTTGGLTELSYSNGRLIYTAANANDGVAGSEQFRLMVKQGQAL